MSSTGQRLRPRSRLQRKEDAKSAAAAAKRPVGRPPKPRPDVTRCVLVNGGMQMEVEMGVCGLWRKPHGCMKADA
jgi:hypothetical protein